MKHETSRSGGESELFFGVYGFEVALTVAHYLLRFAKFAKEHRGYL
jgi:hypothetical protein